MRDIELSVIKLLEVLHRARGVHAAVDQWTVPLLHLLRRLIEGDPFAEEVKHVTMRALAAAMGIARGIADEVENYFGVFMPFVYNNDIILLKELFTSIASPSSVALKDTFPLLRSAPASVIPDILSLLFWLRYFGPGITCISFEDFIAAFSSHYASLSRHILKMLQSSLFQYANTVDIVTYAAYCGTEGLYAAVQRYCDPGTVVVLAGVVDDSYEHHHTAPRVMHSLAGHKIIQVACGGQHAAVLTSDGEVMTWGKGGYGRLGQGHTEALTEPTLVYALQHVTIVKIACGFAYSAAISDTAELYTWGAGENGRLGLGDTRDRHLPCRVSALSHIRVASVAAGSVHTCILSTEGSLFTCGKCEYSGHGSGTDQLVPEHLDYFDAPLRCVTVGPGGYHTIALTVVGEVYSWGHDRVGQLGYRRISSLPRNAEGAYYLPVPKLIPIPERVHLITAGWGHSCVVGKRSRGSTAGSWYSDNVTYVCGRNQHGQLGIDPAACPLNERNHRYSPEFQAIPIHDVKQAAFGGEHSVFVTPHGVLTCGSNNRGQLGQASGTDIHTPTLLHHPLLLARDIKHIACGNSSSLFLVGHFQAPSLAQLCMGVISKYQVLIDSLKERMAVQPMCVPPHLLSMVDLSDVHIDMDIPQNCSSPV